MSAPTSCARCASLQLAYDDYQSQSKELEAELEAEVNNQQAINVALQNKLEKTNALLLQEREAAKQAAAQSSSSSSSSSFSNASAAEITKLTSTIDSLKSSKRSLELEFDDLTTKYRRTESALNDALEKCEKYTENNVILQSEIEEYKQNQNEKEIRTKIEIKELKEELENKKRIIEQQQQTNAAATTSTTPLKSSSSSTTSSSVLDSVHLEEEIALLREEKSALVADMDDLNTDLTQAQEENEKLNAQVEELKTQLEKAGIVIGSAATTAPTTTPSAAAAPAALSSPSRLSLSSAVSSTEIASLKSRIVELNSTLESVTLEHKQLRVELDSTKSQLTATIAAHQQELSATRTNAATQIDELQVQLNKVREESTAAIASKQDELDAVLFTSSKSLVQAETHAQELQTQLEHTQKRVQEVTQEALKTNELMVKQHAEKVSVLERDLQSVRVELSSVLDSSTSHSTTISGLRVELLEAQRSITQLQEERHDSESIAAERNKRIAKLEEQVSAHSSIDKQLATLTRHNEEYQTQIQKLKIEVNTAVAARTTLTTELDALRDSHSTLMKQHATLTTDHATLVATHEQLQSDHHASQSSAATTAATATATAELTASLASKTESLILLQHEYASLQTSLKSMENERTVMQSMYQNKIKTMEEQQSNREQNKNNNNAAATPVATLPAAPTIDLNEHNTRLSALESRHSTRIQELISAHASELQRLEHDHDQNIATLSSTHTTMMNQLRVELSNAHAAAAASHSQSQQSALAAAAAAEAAAVDLESATLLQAMTEQLEQHRIELEQTRLNFIETQSNNKNLQAQLTSVTQQLQHTQTQLQHTQTQLTQSQTQLQQTQLQLTTITNQLQQTELQYTNVQSELTSAQLKSQEFRRSLNVSESQLSSLTVQLQESLQTRNMLDNKLTEMKVTLNTTTTQLKQVSDARMLLENELHLANENARQQAAERAAFDQELNNKSISLVAASDARAVAQLAASSAELELLRARLSDTENQLLELEQINQQYKQTLEQREKQISTLQKKVQDSEANIDLTSALDAFRSAATAVVDDANVATAAASTTAHSDTATSASSTSPSSVASASLVQLRQERASLLTRVSELTSAAAAHAEQQLRWEFDRQSLQAQIDSKSHEMTTIMMQQAAILNTPQKSSASSTVSPNPTNRRSHSDISGDESSTVNESNLLMSPPPFSFGSTSPVASPSTALVPAAASSSSLSLSSSTSSSSSPSSSAPSAEVIELQSRLTRDLDGLRTSLSSNLSDPSLLHTLQPYVDTLQHDVSSSVQLLSNLQSSLSSSTDRELDLMSKLQNLRSTNIRVFCRVRPMLPHELQESHQQQHQNGNPIREEALLQYPSEQQISIRMDIAKKNRTKLAELPQHKGSIGSDDDLLSASTSSAASATSSASDFNSPASYTPFNFDRIFLPHSTQDEVYSSVEEMILPVLNGHRACIFAYGQTGSGKTYTMEGEKSSSAAADALSASVTMDSKEQPNIGITFRALQTLFRGITNRGASYKYEIRMCLLELYNEQWTDLLEGTTVGIAVTEQEEREPTTNTNTNTYGGGGGGATADDDDTASQASTAIPDDNNDNSSSGTSNIRGRPKLTVRKGIHGMYVDGASRRVVSNVQQVLTLLKHGYALRHTDSTALNESSSRSHLLLMVDVIGINQTTQVTSYGRLSLCDLAGSERVKASGSTGTALVEASHINRSLSALADVFTALADSRSKHIPFRNSRLTYLLQDSFVGNSKTLMFVNISPASMHAGETLCSLQFAVRARQVRLNQSQANLDGWSFKYKSMLETQQLAFKEREKACLTQLRQLRIVVKARERTIESLQTQIKLLQDRVIEADKRFERSEAERLRSYTQLKQPLNNINSRGDRKSELEEDRKWQQLQVELNVAQNKSLDLKAQLDRERAEWKEKYTALEVKLKSVQEVLRIQRIEWQEKRKISSSNTSSNFSSISYDEQGRELLVEELNPEVQALNRQVALLELEVKRLKLSRNASLKQQKMSPRHQHQQQMMKKEESNSSSTTGTTTNGLLHHNNSSNPSSASSSDEAPRVMAQEVDAMYAQLAQSATATATATAAASTTNGDSSTAAPLSNLQRVSSLPAASTTAASGGIPSVARTATTSTALRTPSTTSSSSNPSSALVAAKQAALLAQKRAQALLAATNTNSVAAATDTSSGAATRTIAASASIDTTTTPAASSSVDDIQLKSPTSSSTSSTLKTPSAATIARSSSVKAKRRSLLPVPPKPTAVAAWAASPTTVGLSVSNKQQQQAKASPPQASASPKATASAAASHIPSSSSSSSSKSNQASPADSPRLTALGGMHQKTNSNNNSQAELDLIQLPVLLDDNSGSGSSSSGASTARSGGISSTRTTVGTARSASSKKAATTTTPSSTSSGSSSSLSSYLTSSKNPYLPSSSTTSTTNANSAATTASNSTITNNTNANIKRTASNTATNSSSNGNSNGNSNASSSSSLPPEKQSAVASKVAKVIRIVPKIATTTATPSALAGSSSSSSIALAAAVPIGSASFMQPVKPAAASTTAAASSSSSHIPVPSHSVSSTHLPTAELNGHHVVASNDVAAASSSSSSSSAVPPHRASLLRAPVVNFTSAPKK